MLILDIKEPDEVRPGFNVGQLCMVFTCLHLLARSYSAGMRVLLLINDIQRS